MVTLTVSAAFPQTTAFLATQDDADRLEEVFFRCMDREDILLAFIVADRLSELVGESASVYFDQVDAYIEATTPEPFVCPGCPGGWCEGCIPDHSVVHLN